MLDDAPQPVFFTRAGGGLVVGGVLEWSADKEIWAAMGPALAAAVSDLLLVVDRDGVILYINRTEGGVPRERVVGSRAFDYVPPGLRPELERSLAQVFDGAPPRLHDVPATLVDGSRRWYATHTGPVAHDGRIVAATIVARDVTEKLAARRALRESEARYRTLFEQAPEAIVVFDADQQAFVDVNVRACALFGLSREALLQQTPISLSPPEQPDGRPSRMVAWDRIAEALGGGAPEFDWVHRGVDGVDLQCVVRLVRLPEAGRRLVRGTITDVTNQRLLEEHVRQWQKLEAVGHLAGGISHDFNNVLTVIAASADILVAELPDTHPLHVDAIAIREATRRGTALTRQLLAFARKGESAVRRIDLNELVGDAKGWLHRLLGSTIELREELHGDGAPVLADRDQFEQLLVNLVVNARDAMPGGGSITISTARLNSWTPPRDTNCTVRGPVIRLRVADTGAGLDAATRQRIFEPFFSTKSLGAGTGLGLSIVAGVVKQARGCIEVQSEAGVGTRFDVILPEAPGAGLS